MPLNTVHKPHIFLFHIRYKASVRLLTQQRKVVHIIASVKMQQSLFQFPHSSNVLKRKIDTANNHIVYHDYKYHGSSVSVHETS